MKNILFYILVSIFAINSVEAKKVKFAVDMTGQTISPNGVHITGDFQQLAGYGDDWQANTTLLTNEFGTNICSIVVDIPAFHKYEYKYINGDQFYEIEFIPTESRIGYDFNDNRWIYVDSLRNDTTFIGAVQFASNAPIGYKLVRFLVDIQQITNISPEGIHLAGSFQNWNPQELKLYNFDGSTYEIIQFLQSGYYEYNYYNGNTSINIENENLLCMQNNHRAININNDTVLNIVCYAECGDCDHSGLLEFLSLNSLTIYPNPTKEGIYLYLPEANCQVKIVDLDGRILFNQNSKNEKKIYIEEHFLRKGINILSVSNNNYNKTLKIIKQ